MGTVSLRPATADDSELVYQIKKAALGKYVELTWGWDEEYQRQYHEKDFIPADFRIIEVDGETAGVFATRDCQDHLVIGEIYIHPSHQNQGIGTYLIRGVLVKADKRGIPVRLQYLKVNPAGRLYKRLGFTITGENEHHYQMEYRPGQDR